MAHLGIPSKIWRSVLTEEILLKHFPIGVAIALVDSHEACQYKLEVVEFLDKGVVGVNDDGKKIFVPWTSGLVLRERGECDCINCNPDKYDRPSFHGLLNTEECETSAAFSPNDGGLSAIESMLSDLTGARPVDEAISLDENSDDEALNLSESRWRNSKR